MQRPNFGSENNEQLTNSSCASSFTSSGIGSTLRTVTWTPPHSIGTATPTHTEGTPSMTESSESECSESIYDERIDYSFDTFPYVPVCPNTPIRSRCSTRYSRSTLADEEVVSAAAAADDAEVVCTIIGHFP